MGWSGDGSVPVAFTDATDVDAVARLLLRSLMEQSSVRRAGIALTEGGGRRLRFLVTDTLDVEAATWCHIDAYDDVPLTDVVRFGEPVVGDVGSFADRYTKLLAEQTAEGSRALAAVPLPDTPSPLGGLVVFYDSPQEFGPDQLIGLEDVGRATADAVRRVRAQAGRGPAEAAAEVPGITGRASRSATLILAGDPRAAGAARHFLRDQLEQWSVSGDPADSAELCLSELVTNAVIHAGTSSELTVTLEGDELTVAVRDLGGSSRPGDAESTVHLVEDEDPLRVFGRGLVLVDALADRWGSEADATGTTSWFVMELGDLETAAS
ncbi:ATP-binding protein [Nocardioides mangrovi]|uniref:ATP-binding protein n=1 Tax=Nocardioides mangrovi TaxID=2874580 RepID=A0ABS7U9N2_9ACTN|nr:ATP-binding protein [Nocardioides mangrovi]MBZ5737693.1 ATP-binding protein [Nocardioides mangrovi]